MIQIVHPIISSKVGIALEFRIELLFGRVPLPTVLLRRSNIVTVEKLVGPGKPNQKTDVLLVRFMLNLLAAKVENFRDRFGGKPIRHVPTFDDELGRRVRIYQQAGGFKLPLPTLLNSPGIDVLTPTSGGRALAVGDLPPLPPPGPLPPNPPKPLPSQVPPVIIQEPLHVDGIIDPCKRDTDRGSISGLVYTIVHLNYHLMLFTKSVNDMRLAPALLKEMRNLNDPALEPLEKELAVAERNDPDREGPKFRPRFPPGPVIQI